MSSSVDRPQTVPLRPLGPRLIIYRIMAWITGVGLLLLVFYALPVKYIGGNDRPTALIGMIHGFLYMGYILATLVLAERMRWKPVKALLILLAGTIPIASFVAERKITHEVEERQQAAAG